MKELFRQSRSYIDVTSFSRPTVTEEKRFILCDAAEFTKIREHYAENKKANQRFYDEVNIVSEPVHVILDGYHVYSGRKFRAKGLEVYTRYDSWELREFFFTKENIISDEVVKSESWWG